MKRVLNDIPPEKRVILEWELNPSARATSNRSPFLLLSTLLHSDHRSKIP